MRYNSFTVALVIVLAMLALSRPASAYYDPALGRFISRDPIGYMDGPSLYEYVRSQPAASRDPTGFGVIDDIIGIIWPPGGTAPYDPFPKPDPTPEPGPQDPPSGSEDPDMAYQPLPSSSPKCGDYPCDYQYAGANARCFCKNAGDSDWAQMVRGCLNFYYHQGAGPNAAHVACYMDADKKYPRPNANLAAAYALCKE